MEHKIKQKVCRSCAEIKDSSEFSYGRRTCKPCRSKEEIQKYWSSPEEYRKKKRGKSKTPARTSWEQRNKEYGYSWHLKKTYNLSRDDYNNLLVAQENKCAICGAEEQERMVVDHCHTTGSVRGLLCNSCNCGLGFFQDNIEFMKKAIAYIKINDKTTTEAHG